jgi:tetratricopeptide (TPR) repeat protein
MQDIEQKEIKNYLLGFVSLDEGMEQIEKRMLTDEKYFKQMLSVEDELIQDYVDGELSEKDKKAFERHLLSSQENRNNVRFSRALRKYVNSREPVEIAAPVAHTVREKWSFTKIFGLSPVYGFSVAAASILVLLFAGLGLSFYWQYSAKQSVIAKREDAIASFNNSFSSGRPFESRITGQNYGAFSSLKGGNPQTDTGELKPAKNIANLAKLDPSPANSLLLARVYLSEKNFDGAELELEKVQKLDPDNAEVYNDLGVAAFEKARLLEPEDGARPGLITKAREYFDQAIRLRPGFLEALFNKAQCLEELHSVNEAKAAWQEYRTYDSTSNWAHEADQHLLDLGSQK